MKKIIIAMALAATVGSTALAQTYASSEEELQALRSELDDVKSKQAKADEKDATHRIWHRSKFFNVSYIDQTLKAPDMEVKPGDQNEWKNQWGVGISLGNTYYLHRPILGIIRFGIDAIWFDASYSQYKKGDLSSLGDIMDIDPDNIDLDNPGTSLPDPEDIDLGMHQLELGMGIGPSVGVAPFRHLGSMLQPLKAGLYFHYHPSYSGILMTNDGETKVNHTFVNFFSFGAHIDYKLLSVGVESRWGNAKYKMESFDGDSDLDKMKFETNSTRFYVSLRF